MSLYQLLLIDFKNFLNIYGLKFSLLSHLLKLHISNESKIILQIIKTMSFLLIHKLNCYYKL